MKIAINAASFPASLSIPQGLRIAKRAGFDAVELNITEKGYLSLDMSDEDVLSLRRAANNMSIEYLSVSSGLWWDYPLTSPDPEVVEATKDVVRLGLSITKNLGAKTLLVVPGQVNENIPYEVAYERALAALKELARDAEHQGVQIGVENVWNKFLLSPLEMRDFIDEIGSEYVKVYFDVANILAYGYPDQWIRILGDRITNLHVRDYSASIGNLSGFVNALQGDVNWIGVRNALRDVGFDGVVTAEVPGYKTLPDLGIRHTGEAVRRIFIGSGSNRKGEDMLI